MPEILTFLEPAIKYFGTVSEGIAITDKEYSIVWHNKIFKEIFGLKKLKGTSALNIIEKISPLKFNGTYPDSISYR